MSSNFSKKILHEFGNFYKIENPEEKIQMENYYSITLEYMTDYLSTHVCSVCGVTIEKGAPYQQSKGTYNDGWTEYKICFDCLENKNFIMDSMGQENAVHLDDLVEVIKEPI